MIEGMKRRVHTPEFRAKVELEAVRGLKTVSEIAQSGGCRADLTTEQRRLDQERREHAAVLEKTTERSRLAEERFADMEKRALLEIDRERTAAAMLQKSLESERAAHAATGDRLAPTRTRPKRPSLGCANRSAPCKIPPPRCQAIVNEGWNKSRCYEIS